jgi:hypothetical protein
MRQRRLGPVAVAAFIALAGCGQAAPSATPRQADQLTGGAATFRPGLEPIWEVVRADPRMARAAALLDDPAYPLLTILEDHHDNRFHTLFAPSNEAFDALPDAIAARLAGEGEDPDRFIKDVITMHWAEDADLDPSRLASGTAIHAARTHLTYTVVDGDAFVDYASVVDVLPAANGYVYLIDTVLIPPCIVDVGQAEPPAHEPCPGWLEPPTG